MNVSSFGVIGISRAEALASRSASSLVEGAVTQPTDTSAPQDIVNLQQAGADVAIGAKLVETGSQLTKTLLDIFA